MLKVFIPSKILLDIYYDNGSKQEEELSSFCRLLKYTRDIYVTGMNLNDYELFDERNDSDARSLKIMEAQFQFVIHNADEYIKEIKNDNSKVLEEACAAFYIDGISREDAARIQTEFGVICQPANDPINMDYYMQPMETYDLKKYSKDNIQGQKWKDVFSLPQDVPSNAICIIDRNLFAYDGEPYTVMVDGEAQSKIKTDGLQNLFAILNHALPKSFVGDSFDVSILFEQECIKEVFTFETLCGTIFGAIDLLNRKYKVNATIIAFRHGNRNQNIKAAKYYNELTHTRQIISNYYRISAENGLNTTMHDENNNGKSNYSQVLYSMLLFSSGLRRAGADPAEITIRRIDADFRRLIEYWKDNPDTEEYWLATNYGGESVYDISNRLFI